jgi:hypothetical protein
MDLLLSMPANSAEFPALSKISTPLPLIRVFALVLL